MLYSFDRLVVIQRKWKHLFAVHGGALLEIELKYFNLFSKIMIIFMFDGHANCISHIFISLYTWFLDLKILIQEVEDTEQILINTSSLGLTMWSCSPS